MIPLHPQAGTAPDELRWVTPSTVLPFDGRVAAAPGPLATLMGDGTLVEVRLEPRAVITRLGRGRTWSRDGSRVRTALHAALAEPDAWRPDQDAGERSEDALLRAAAQELLDGPAGRLARSHAGTIDLVDVRAGTVRVRLGGACDGCPAARNTLRDALERQLRERFPELRAVTAVGRTDGSPADTRPCAVGRKAPSPLSIGLRSLIGRRAGNRG